MDTGKERKGLVTQLCPTLCDPVDCSPLGSSVHGIIQVRILEWVAMPFPRGSCWPRDQTQNLFHCKQILYHLSHQVNLGSLSRYTHNSIFELSTELKPQQMEDISILWASQVALVVNNLFPMQETPLRWLGNQPIPGLGRSSGRRAWQPTAIVLPGESHGQRSPQAIVHGGHKELDMTEP